jgi:hypothetical protein
MRQRRHICQGFGEHLCRSEWRDVVLPPTAAALDAKELAYAEAIAEQGHLQAGMSPYAGKAKAAWQDARLPLIHSIADSDNDGQRFQLHRLKRLACL